MVVAEESAWQAWGQKTFPFLAPMCLPQGLLLPDWTAGTIPLFPRGHRRGLGRGLELAVEGQSLWLGHEGDRCWALILGSVFASWGRWEQHRPCSVGIVPVPRQGVWLVTHPEML